MRRIDRKSIKDILLELVLLAVLVGLIPELIVSGMSDMFGVCGFAEDVCKSTQLQGSIKALCALFCGIFAVVVGFILSNEFDVSDNSEEM